jgi:multidrug efflux pump
VRFRLEKDPDDAAADVRDRVARVRSRLPQAADEPQVAKVEADAQADDAGWPFRPTGSARWR